MLRFKAELYKLAYSTIRSGYANSTNRDSIVSPSVSTAGQNFTNADDLPTDPLIPDLEDTGIFSGAYDDEDVGAEADLNNLETTMNVSPIPTTRIHKDYPKDQIIEDINSATKTRRMIKITEEHAMNPRKWDLPKGKRAIGTKWVYRNKKDERGIVVRNKARLVAQGGGGWCRLKWREGWGGCGAWRSDDDDGVVRGVVMLWWRQRCQSMEGPFSDGGYTPQGNTCIDGTDRSSNLVLKRPRVFSELSQERRTDALGGSELSRCRQNGGQGYSARGAGAVGYGRAQNRVGNANPGQVGSVKGLHLQLYNDLHDLCCRSVSHTPRNTVDNNLLNAELATYKDQLTVEKKGQKQLTQNNFFGSQDIVKRKAVQAPQRDRHLDHQALTVYPPNTPATLVPTECLQPKVSEVKSTFYTLDKALTKKLNERMSDAFDELEAELGIKDCDRNMRLRLERKTSSSDMITKLLIACLNEVFYAASIILCSM
ncbi:putative ribonuclease H-like domain-containing protein [Tanacetum coccineum]